MSFKEKYGPWGLIAGASEGLGTAFARALAKQGINLVLIARREELLKSIAAEIRNEFSVEVEYFAVDLAREDSAERIRAQVGEKEINLLVYNAAAPFIGLFLSSAPAQLSTMTSVNMLTPLHLVHHFGADMVRRGRGGIVLMSSLAGFQGSGFLSLYAATKAFNRVLAEGLWYEWKSKGVDVIACCAGATATPNYIKSNPGKISFFAPRVQTPEAVADECLARLGSTPSFVTGTANRIASFMMSRIFSRKRAITIMGDTTRKMYGIKE